MLRLHLAFACDFEDCGRRFSCVSILRRHCKVHKGAGSSPFEPFYTTKVHQGEISVKGAATNLESGPELSHNPIALSQYLSLDE